MFTHLEKRLTFLNEPQRNLLMNFNEITEKLEKMEKIQIKDNCKNAGMWWSPSYKGVLFETKEELTKCLLVHIIEGMV